MTELPQNPDVAAAPAAAYRFFHEDDWARIAELDERRARHEDPQFDALDAREREGRLHSSVAALRFYGRSDHSFVAERSGQIVGLALAQTVWQGDGPIVLVRTVFAAPELEAGLAGELKRGLLRAVFKSAYDAAAYEVHWAAPEGETLPPELGEVRDRGRHLVRHLGGRNATAPH